MLQEIDELQNELQKAEAMNAHELSREAVASPSTVEELLQELEEAKRKHWAESQVLITKLNVAKRDLEDLSKELQREKVSRVQAETEKLEAVEIAEALFHKLDNMQRVSEEDQLRHEILELQQIFQKEKDLRNQAETENLKDF